MKKRFNKRLTAWLVVTLLVFNLIGISSVSFAASTSTDLADFLTNLTIDAALNASNEYIVKPGVEYELSFKFKEGETKQFDNAAQLIYKIPNGLLVENINDVFSVNINSNGTQKTIQNNTFQIVDASGGGKNLVVQFNDSDPNYSSLTSAANVQFDIDISAKFADGVSVIVFSDQVTKHFEFDDTRNLTITKTGAYDAAAGSVNYTLVVTSTGVNDNVVVTDIINGTALTYNDDLTVTSDVSDPVQSTNNKVGNGFKLDIPLAKDNEVFTIKYSASIDYSKITNTTHKLSDETSDVVNGTINETNNTAQVKSDQVTVPKTAQFNLKNKIKLTILDKKAIKVDDLTNGKKQIKWQIVVNGSQKKDMSGLTLEDVLSKSQEHRIFFNGTGVQVSKYDGTHKISTNNISWNDPSLVTTTSTTSGQKNSWKYTFPDGSGKYKYSFVFTTEVDVTGVEGPMQMSNDAKLYFPGLTSFYKKNALYSVSGSGNMTFSKEVVSYSSDEVKWKMTATNVPSAGFTGKTWIQDNLPRLWLDSAMRKDEFKPGSLVITGLLPGESFETTVKNGNENQLIIQFYKDTAKTQPGLQATPDNARRNISIEMITTVDQYWLNYAADKGYLKHQKHHNNASFRSNFVNAHGQTEGMAWFASADVYPKIERILKALQNRSEVTIGGKQYPVFNYVLTLENPHVVPLTIDEIFNTNYLRFYSEAANPVIIKGGTADAQNTEGGTANLVDNATGGKIEIATLPKDNSDAFFPVYKIYYALIVKDEAALAQLNNAALQIADGSVELSNTATWLGKTSGEIKTNYNYDPYVDKQQTTAPTKTNQYMAGFKITVNKFAKDLVPNIDSLAVEDVLSNNLRLDLESVVISPNSNNVKPSFDEATNTLSFIGLPDEQTIDISYQARVLGGIGNASYENTVTLAGYSKKIKKTIKIESTGGGSGTIPSITLVKIDENDTTKKLSGAEFQLYYVDANGVEQPLKDKHNQDVVFETGSGSNPQGEVLIAGDQGLLGWALWVGKSYVLKEIKAPAGYKNEHKKVTFEFADPLETNTQYPISGAKLYVTNGKYKLGNHVWYDDNHNGIQDAGENGVKNVKVVLKDELDNELAETLTDSDGNYIFKGLDNGTYKVAFSNLPADYQATKTDVGSDDTVDSDGLTATGTIADADNLTLDLGIVKAYKLGNYVWYDNNKNGIQDAGETGVKDVKVVLKDKNDNKLAETTTGTAGKYEFNGLVNGDYKVTFSNLPADYQATKTDVGSDDTVDSDGLTATGTIADADNLTLDLGIVKKVVAPVEKHKLGDLVWLDTNKNGVQDTGEPGVPGVTVALYTVTSGGAISTTPAAVQLTKPNGTYLFDNLADGNYQVVFSNIPSGHIPTAAHQGGDASKDSDGPTIAVTLSNDNLTLDLGLVKTTVTQLYKLGNYVWYDDNENGIQDGAEKGVKDVTVKLYRVTTGGAFQFINATTTDGVGEYQFGGLTNGDYKVAFSNLPTDYQATKKDVGSDDQVDSDGLTASGTIYNADNLTLDLGIVKKAVTVQKYKLGDYVWYDDNKNGIQDSTEKGVKDVLVTLTKPDGTVLATTKTDHSGHYLFSNLTDGDYKVVFSNLPAGYKVTRSNRGSDDSKDSDGRNPLGKIAGADNLTLDLGLVKQSTSGGGSNRKQTTTTTTTTTAPTTTTTVTGQATTTAGSSTTVSATETTEAVPTTAAPTTERRYVAGNTPDPNNSDSPDVIVVLDDNGTPLGKYYKQPDPAGGFIYVDEAGVALGTTKVVKTGNDFPEVLFMMITILALIGATVLRKATKKSSL